MIVADDPVVPWWLKIAVSFLLGGILLVLQTVVLEEMKLPVASCGIPWRSRMKLQTSQEGLSIDEDQPHILLLNSAEIPGKRIIEILGLVQGHTIFAIFPGNDLS